MAFPVYSGSVSRLGATVSIVTHNVSPPTQTLRSLTLMLFLCLQTPTVGSVTARREEGHELCRRSPWQYSPPESSC